jgi:Cytochrome C'
MRMGWGSAFCASLIAMAITAVAIVPVVSIEAQGGGPRAAAAAQSRGASSAQGRGTGGSQMRTDVDLLHVMRGILFPSSNVVFAAQDDLSVWKPAADPSTSPNPLTSTYGGWTAVENASLALVESANLLLIPGRLCSSGKPVPVQRADWIKFVQGLRDAGNAAYKAAQSKNQDAIVAATGDLADACSACHAVYREKPGTANRCVP